jgi:hypothetical protein
VECQFRFCTAHKDGNLHEGETCEEYEYRRSGQKEKDEKAQEEASVKAITKLAKKCPGKGCGWQIEKNDGCDHSKYHGTNRWETYANCNSSVDSDV